MRVRFGVYRTMATDQTRPIRDDAPDDPEDLLPEESVLSLDEYLEMHAAVGHRTVMRSSIGSSTAAR